MSFITSIVFGLGYETTKMAIYGVYYGALWGYYYFFPSKQIKQLTMQVNKQDKILKKLDEMEKRHNKLIDCHSELLEKNKELQNKLLDIKIENEFIDINEKK